MEPEHQSPSTEKLSPDDQGRIESNEDVIDKSSSAEASAQDVPEHKERRIRHPLV